MKPQRKLIPLLAEEEMKTGKYAGLKVKDLAMHRPDHLLFLNSLGRYEIDYSLIRIAENRIVELGLEGELRGV